MTSRAVRRREILVVPRLSSLNSALELAEVRRIHAGTKTSTDGDGSLSILEKEPTHVDRAIPRRTHCDPNLWMTRYRTGPQPMSFVGTLDPVPDVSGYARVAEVHRATIMRREADIQLRNSTWSYRYRRVLRSGDGATLLFERLPGPTPAESLLHRYQQSRPPEQ